MALFVDRRSIGIPKPIPDNSKPHSPQGLLRLGAGLNSDGTPNLFFTGRIDEIRVSKTARYNKTGFTPAKRFEPDADTIALFHCDKLTGELLQDVTGNGHHGKIVGAKRVRVDLGN